MLKDIVLLGIGAIFGLGATMASVAAPSLFPNTPSWIWYWLFWGGIALMALTALDATFLVIWRPRFSAGLLANIGLLFSAAAVISQFSPSYTTRAEQREITESTEAIGPVIGALRQYQAALSDQENAQRIIQQIIDQYDQLERATAHFELITGSARLKDRLASAQQTISNIQALLQNVHVKATQRGNVLLIKTAWNNFRVTFAAPMRVPPNVIFHGLPSGVVPHIVESSNVGFTVVFTPSAIPVDDFDLTLSSEL